MGPSIRRVLTGASRLGTPTGEVSLLATPVADNSRGAPGGSGATWIRAGSRSRLVLEFVESRHHGLKNFHH